MNWKSTRLSDFLAEQDGRIKYEVANSLRLQRIKKIDFSGSIHLDSETDTKTDMIRVRPGDLVISGINAAKGAIAVYEDEVDVLATIHYSAYQFNPDRISVEFLKWFFKSPEFADLLKEQVPGGIKTELKPKHILPLEIKLPSLSQQLAITNRLNRFRFEHLRIEHEVAYQESLLAKLRQAILEEAIQGKLTADWRASHANVEPAKALVQRIQEERTRLIAAKKLRRDKPLRTITAGEVRFKVPEQWEWCRLGQLFLSLQYGTSQKCNYDSSQNTAILRIPNVSTGKLSMENLKFTNLTKTEKEKYSLKKDDVLMIRSNGSASLVGSAVLFDEEAGNYGYAGYLMRLRFSTEICSAFIVAALASRTLRDQVEEPLRTTVGINNINSTEVANLKIPLPPPAEQAVIVARVEELMKVCSALESKIEHTKAHAAHLLRAVVKEAFAPAAS